MNRLAAALSTIAVMAGCASAPQRLPPPPHVKEQLAPTGVLRVAALTSNPIIGTKDARTGELKGTTVALGQALAREAGVPAKMIEYTAIARLVVDATTNAWDVAVVAIDAAGVGGEVRVAPAEVIGPGSM